MGVRKYILFAGTIKIRIAGTLQLLILFSMLSFPFHGLASHASFAGNVMQLSPQKKDPTIDPSTRKRVNAWLEAQFQAPPAKRIKF